jgi:multidrug efflux system outer membrane protein
MNYATLFFSVGLLASGVMLSACSSYKSVDTAAQQAQMPVLGENFSLEGRFQAAEPEVAWWQQLDDEPLKQLVDLALDHNRDIRVAQASLVESRALLRNSRFDWFPTVEADVSANRQKTSTDLLPPVAETISETYQAGFDAYWELDLFGRTSQQVNLSEAQLAARFANLHAVQVSIAAEVAGSYIALRGSQYLLQVAQNSERNQEESFNLTQKFAEVGRGDQLDISRAQAQLELTRAHIPTLQAQIRIAQNRLAVLTHQSAEHVAVVVAKNTALPSLPTTLAVGNPLGLLQRRPDIQYAEQALKGAVAEYNVRVADLYPRITLNGSLGYLSTDWSRLGETPTETFIFAPSIRWAAFNLGRVHTQIDAADARTQARIAEFEQTVLRALEETDNALQNFSREEERRQRLQQAAAASSQAAYYARQKFEIGSGDFLSVLDAERSQLNVNAQLAQSETQLLLNLVAVYKALGGGWETYGGSSQLSLSF